MKRFRPTLAAFASTIAVVATLSVAPQTALAAESSGESQVCTIGVAPMPLGTEPPVEPDVAVSCFDDREAAEAFILNGAPGDIEQLGVASTRGSVASTVILGYVWTGLSRSGSQLIHWGAGGTCSGVTYGFPSMSGTWNNSIQSAEGKGSCWATLYDEINYAGSRVNCTPYCSTLSSLNGRASSVVYRPVGTFG